MNALKLKRVSYENPSPEERRRNIEAIRWWWFDYVDYHPHLAQIDFHISPARFRMAIAGTRGGKSRAAGEEAVLYLLAGATRVWIVGQTYRLTEKEFRYIYERMTSPQMIAMFGGRAPLESAVYNPDQGNMRIRTVWGAEVECISLERGGAGALGEECDLIIMSEGAQIRKPKNLWERYLRGRLASRHGDLLIPTTPAGKTNAHDEEGWLFEMYEKGYDEFESDYYTREWPSWENPDFKEDPYELRRSMDSRVFSEQYEGKFMIFSGAVMNFEEDVHVIDPFDMPPHWRAYEAIDPGYSGKFVWLRSIISPSGCIFITDEYSDSETVFEDRADAIKRHRAEQYRVHPTLWDVFCRKHEHKTTTYLDSEDPQAAAEFTEKYGIPCQPTTKEAKNVVVSVNRVNERLKFNNRYPPKLFITANCVETIDACKFHSWGEKTVSRAGRVQLRRPANDQWKHWGDCLRYITCGHLIPSEPKEYGSEPTGDRYWDLLTEVGVYGSGHPHELSRSERRRIA